jgi:sarcosine oxidase, subunit gamma
MADVSFMTLPPAARLAARGGETAATLIGMGFGIALPRAVCRAATDGTRSALWLGPDEWLLIAPNGEASALARKIAGALGNEPASVVDVSDRNLAIEVRGPKAAETLNGFNPLDLDPTAFPVGMCTRTLFGKAEIVLWRPAAATFRIEVWRSFAPYVLGCLGEAAREYA